jgi:hypothetical protein
MIVLIIEIITMGIKLNLKKEKSETFKLKVKESVTTQGLTITNKGGGNKRLIKGGEFSYAEIILQTQNKKEIVYTDAFGKKLWNSYLIDFKEVGKNGEYVKVSVKKLGEPKITADKALDIVNEYIISKLGLGEKYLNDADINLDDLGEYYSIEINSRPESKKNINYSLKVDKFTGEITNKK